MNKLSINYSDCMFIKCLVFLHSNQKKLQKIIGVSVKSNRTGHFTPKILK